MKKKIVFVTGTRADFGKLEPLAHAALECNFDVEFFVTGMHMLKRYGMTKHEVSAISIFRSAEFINQRSGDALEVVLAKTVSGFSDYVEEQMPDLVVVHGDRVEALAACIVCATKYIRCAHIEGGEISGTIDEMFRHCNSKLAAFHFVSSEEARGRVMRLGEPADSIAVIGSPELDVHARPTGLSMEEVRRRYDIGFAEFGIAVFHTVTSEVDSIKQQTSDLFGALVRSERNFVVILPNNDPGSSSIFSVIEELPKERFRVLPSMRFRYFSELMRNASVIVGNSSLGVREAPFLGIPSLNVGTRQAKRSRSPSICHVAASSGEQIRRFLEEEWGKRYQQDLSFGTGNASEKFKEILLADEFWARPLQKQFCDSN